MPFVDTPTDAPAGQPTPWWRYALIGMAVLLALLGAAAVVLKYRGLRELRAARVEYEKLKLPESMEAIIKALPPISDEENMAVALLPAAEAIAARNSKLTAGAQPGRGSFASKTVLVLRHHGEPWMQYERIALQRFSSIHAAGIQQLIDACRRPYGRFHIQWVEPTTNILLPHLSPVRGAANALALEATAAAQRGEIERSMEALQALFRSIHCLDEPALFLITSFVQMGMADEGICAIESLAMCEQSDAALASLQRQLSPLSTIDRLREVLRGEYAWEMATLDSIYAGRSTLQQVVVSGPPATNLPLRLVPGLRDHDAAAMMQLITESLNALDESATGIGNVRQYGEIEKRLMELPRTCVLTKTLMPSLSRSILVLIRGVAYSRTAVVALAAERYRLRHGDWPAALADLAPEFLAELPMDPFTNEPLKYVRDVRGIVIYSVGEDGVDMGGEVAVPASQRMQGARWQPRDVGIRLLHAPLRRPEAVLQTH